MTTAATARNASVDYLRFIGALGIILFHMGLPGAWIGLSALPMFVALIVFFGMGRPVATHARRLLIPWAIWSAIYGGAKIAQALVTDGAMRAEFAPWMLLTGLSLHLWFLPFAFFFLLVARSILRFVSLPVLQAAAVLISLAALLAANTATLPTPLPQWCATLPAALAGAVMARSRHPWPALAVLGGGSALLILLGWQQATWQLLIASLALAAALSLPLAANRMSDWAAGVSFGMYLIHPLVYAAALYVLPRYTWKLYLLVVAGAVLGTLALKRLLPRAV